MFLTDNFEQNSSKLNLVGANRVPHLKIALIAEVLDAY